MPSFDGDNLLITLDAATPLVDVQVDLYSDWKEWLKTAPNAKFPLAFSTEGGSPTITGEVSGRNFFLRNDLGWRIRPAEEDAEIVLVGNLFKTDETLAMIIPTTGTFTVVVTTQRSSLSLVEDGDISGQIVEGTVTVQQALRGLMSVLLGKISGAGTGTEVFRDVNDTKDRVTATVDASGNRLTVVLSLD